MRLKDESYMRRCFDLARLSAGLNAPNPRVGAVVVYQDKIIGEGYHQQYGGPHAEVQAIRNVSNKDKQFLEKSTIYVSLEPCFHTGKTPPCVDLILKHKIPRVVVSCVDPFEQVAGRSIAKLRAQGVSVTEGLLQKEGAWLCRRFFTTVQKKRPYILLKFAQSKDGFIGSYDQEITISNPLSKRLVHKWRSESTAILVGTTTAVVDNPQLNNRYFFGASPLRLVLDKSLRIPEDAYLLNGPKTTWVFTEHPKQSNRSNLQYIPLSFDAHLLRSMLEYLQQQKIQSLMVEGGGQLLQSFIDADLWDEARILTSNTTLKQGVKAPVLSNHKIHQVQSIADNQLTVFLRQ